MSFVPRAERAKARGDYTRAILVLVEGLKRYPGDTVAIDLLVEWYSVLHPLPGLEPDVVKAILVQPNPDDLLSTLVDNLRGSDEKMLATTLLQQGEALGLRYVPLRKDETETRPAETTTIVQDGIEGPDVTAHGLPVAVTEEPLVEVPLPVEERPAVHVIDDPSPGETRRPFRVSKTQWMVGILAILLIVSGWFVFQRGRVHIAVHSLDVQLSTIDPLDTRAIEANAQEALRVGKGWSDVEERVEFVRILSERESKVKLPEDSKTAWGAASHAFSAMDRGDIESAIRFVTRLERLFPNELPTLWAQLRLAEVRGNMDLWEELATGLTQTHPEFPPGWMASVRVGAFHIDEARIEKAQGMLRKLKPEHPYLGSPSNLLEHPPTSEPDSIGALETGAEDDFLRATIHLRTANAAIQEKRFEDAKQEVEKALEVYPLLTAAKVLDAILRLHQFDLQGVEILRSVRGRVETLAVPALVAVGRPDLAREFESGVRSEEKPQDDTSAHPIEHSLDMGEYTKVISLYREMDEESRPQYAPLAIVAYVALGQFDDAQAELNVGVSLIQDMERQGARLVYLARRNPHSIELQDLFKRIEAIQPTGISRIVDMAYAAFWMGDVAKSEALLERVLTQSPTHRRANWLSGVLFRARGEFRGAEQRFQKARGSELTSASLIELGQMYLSLGNFDEARKMFHKALMMDRENLEALSGLGMAYTRLEPETSQRDLERITQGYVGVDVRAQRAEALKWLAICYGSRQGTAESLAFLDQAEQLVGKRADLLVEKARHMEALGDFTAARALYASALQSNSTLADAHLGLGRTALRVKDTRVAKDHLEKYLELLPGGEDRAWVESRLAGMK